MNSDPLTENNYCRLARAIMQCHRCDYNTALGMLGQFKLNLVCDENIKTSAALQAALLTAVNSGKRAFHGGVKIEMPENVQSLLPWPTTKVLNEIVLELGGELGNRTISKTSHTLFFGKPSDPFPDDLVVLCSGWRGGVAPANSVPTFSKQNDFALGGVLAGSLGVAKGFLRISGLSYNFVEEPVGFSLWNPSTNWLLPSSDEPALQFLPARLWFLGLGHLGQAFIWNLGLLPYEVPQEAEFLLKDFDRIVEGNWSAGLLCEKTDQGIFKTRLCAGWLERRGFKTQISERAFDSNTKRTREEPFIALCGFDNPEGRKCLEDSGFDLVVECGLGANAEQFDSILLHTFPDASQTAFDIWRVIPQDGQRDEQLVNQFNINEDCGILAQTIAHKAVSTSFVGAFAGALVIGELLRGLHGGQRCELLNVQLRSNDSASTVMLTENYQNRFGRNGFVAAMTSGKIS